MDYDNRYGGMEHDHGLCEARDVPVAIHTIGSSILYVLKHMETTGMALRKRYITDEHVRWGGTC